MDIIEAQISEIKNLNLIYVFSTDDILKNDLNKYIGAKVVYNKNKVFSLDYTSKYFEQFIKRILDRYNKEKEKRNIILLGDLSKKLVNDSFFTITKDNKNKSQEYGLLFTNRSVQINNNKNYIIKAITSILKAVKGYDSVQITNIDGFNYKYIIDYNVGNISKKIYLLMFLNSDNEINFKIKNIDQESVNIFGSIINDLTSININWKDEKNDLIGFITFDGNENLTTERISKSDKVLISNEITDTLLDEDEDIIKFYFDLCNIDIINNCIKIDDNSFLLSSSEALINDKDGNFYKNIGCTINIFDDEVIIHHVIKNGLSKYNGQIKVTLDENINDYTLKKLYIDKECYLLIEKKTNDNINTYYNYEIIKIEDTPLNKPFDVTKRKVIKKEMKNLGMIKQYINNWKDDNNG